MLKLELDPHRGAQDETMLSHMIKTPFTSFPLRAGNGFPPLPGESFLEPFSSIQTEHPLSSVITQPLESQF